jgi:hypothetical protein
MSPKARTAIVMLAEEQRQMDHRPSQAVDLNEHFGHDPRGYFTR